MLFDNHSERFQRVQGRYLRIIHGGLDASKLADYVMSAHEFIEHVENGRRGGSTGAQKRLVLRKVASLSGRPEPHGVWLKHPSCSGPGLQLTKGASTQDPTHPAGRRKRVIDPEGILVKAAELRKFVPLIDNATKTAGRLEQDVRSALI